MAFTLEKVVGTSANIASQILTQRDIVLKAGDYVLDQPLPPMRAGQHIRGTAPATRIVVNYETNGVGDSSYVFHMQGDGAAVTDLEIWSPFITASAPSARTINSAPWSIFIEVDVVACRVENVRLGNTPRGILAQGGNFKILHVTGSCPRTGLRVDINGHTGTVHALHLNEPWLDNWLSTDLVTWMYANTEAVELRRVDGFSGSDFRIGHCNIGVQIEPTQAGAGWEGSAGGHIVGGGIEAIQPIYVYRPRTTQEWIGNMFVFNTMYFSGGVDLGSGTPGSVAFIDSESLDPDEEAHVMFANCLFPALPNTSSDVPVIYCHRGKLEMSSCCYNNFDGDRQLFVRVSNGEISMTGGSVGGNQGFNAVALESGCRNATFTGVRCLKDRIGIATSGNVEYAALTPAPV